MPFFIEKLMNRFICLCVVLMTGFASAQSAIIKGVVTSENNFAVVGVNIITNFGGTTTNNNGFYELSVPSNQSVMIVFSHISYKNASLSLTLRPNEEYEFHPVLSEKIQQIGEVIVKKNRR